MGRGVFANGMEIAHKAGDNTVTAAFPDVCLSPPGPPAGPMPVPYPNTSRARDLQGGSRSVLIGGQPLALKDLSFYLTAPLGDEAATQGLGAGIITHTIGGKTYFQAASMNVFVEGKPVCRHLDVTTSNHASLPGNAGLPLPSLESMSPTVLGPEDRCKCCGGPKHSAAQDREPMTQTEYYAPSKTGPATVAAAKAAGCDIVHANDADPCAAHYPTTAEENRAATREYAAMMSPLTPDDYFMNRYGAKVGREVQERGRRMRQARRRGAKSIAHKTARSAGGCPIGEGNLAPVHTPCDTYEKLLADEQGTLVHHHRRAHGLP
jgi:hypothetical protein